MLTAEDVINKILEEELDVITKEKRKIIAKRIVDELRPISVKMIDVTKLKPFPRLAREEAEQVLNAINRLNEK